MSLESEKKKKNEDLGKFNYRYIIQIFYNPITSRIFTIIFSAILLAIALATGVGITAAIVGLCISVAVSIYGISAEVIKHKELYQIKSADKKSSKFVELKDKEGKIITYVKDKDPNNISQDYKDDLVRYLLKPDNYKPIFSHFQNDLMKSLSEAKKGEVTASRHIKNLLLVYGPEIFLPLATIPLNYNLAGLLAAKTAITDIIGSVGSAAWKLIRSNNTTIGELDTKNQNAKKLASDLGIDQEKLKDKNNHKNIAIEMQKRYEIAKINEIITSLYNEARRIDNNPNVDKLQKIAIEEFKKYGVPKHKKNVPFYITQYLKTNISYKAKTKFNQQYKKKKTKILV